MDEGICRLLSGALCHPQSASPVQKVRTDHVGVMLGHVGSRTHVDGSSCFYWFHHVAKSLSGFTASSHQPFSTSRLHTTARGAGRRRAMADDAPGDAAAASAAAGAKKSRACCWSKKALAKEHRWKRSTINELGPHRSINEAVGKS